MTFTEADEAASHSLAFLGKVVTTAKAIDAKQIEAMADRLVQLREAGGRLFILGLGGSAANASHAVNDFVKLCGIHAFAPMDNVAEMTARINDDGWRHWLADWLKARALSDADALLVLSVGGGDAEADVSANLCFAESYAKQRGATVMGIVGRDGGYTKIVGDIVVHVPPLDPDLITPLAESFQSVVLHALVSHPKLAVQKAKWESLTEPLLFKHQSDDFITHTEVGYEVVGGIGNMYTRPAA